MEIKQTKPTLNQKPIAEKEITPNLKQCDFFEQFESTLKTEGNSENTTVSNFVLYSNTADGRFAASMMANLLYEMRCFDYHFISIDKPIDLTSKIYELLPQFENNSKVFLLDCVFGNFEDILRIFAQSENNIFVINFEKDSEKDGYEITKSVSRKIFEEFKFEYHEKADVLYGTLNAIELNLNYLDWYSSDLRMEIFGIVKMIEQYNCGAYNNYKFTMQSIFTDIVANKTIDDLNRIGFIIGKAHYNEVLAKLKYKKLSEFVCVCNFPYDNFVRLILESKSIDTEFYLYQDFSIDGKENTITIYHLGFSNIMRESHNVILNLYKFCNGFAENLLCGSEHLDFFNFDNSFTLPASILNSKTIFSVKNQFNDFMENNLCVDEEIDDDTDDKNSDVDDGADDYVAEAYLADGIEDVNEDITQEDADKLNELVGELCLKQKDTKRDANGGAGNTKDKEQEQEQDKDVSWRKPKVGVCIDPVEADKTTIKTNMKPNIKTNIDISGRASEGCILIDITEVPQESYFQMLCNIFKILTKDSKEPYEKYESIFDVNREPSTNKVFLVINYPNLCSINNKFNESNMVQFVNEVVGSIMQFI